MENKQIQKPPVEIYYLKELEALKANDSGPKPPNWCLSPKSVKAFILGLDKPLLLNNEKVYITKKFFGDDLLIERCIITLAGNRGLMLVGEPGTAKTMLSELLSAAISGVSTNTIQATAGLTEDMVKYSWNYALLLSKGATQEALIPSPIYVGMEKGILVRFEEITRASSQVQDSLISIISDKVLSIPELGEGAMLFSKPGFNIIATANTRDKGVNEMSSALKRRFNFETVFPIADVTLEAKIIEQEAEKLLKTIGIEANIDRDAVQLLATTFHELREGESKEGIKIDKPNSVMSTAEAISVYCLASMNGYYYGNGKIDLDYLVTNIVGTVVKENREDLNKLQAYFDVVVKAKSTKEGKLWMNYYMARKNLK